jgi:hypothetical protein
MGRIRFFVTVTTLLAVAAFAVPASRAVAGQQNTCPPVPPPGSRVNGGLLVTGPCVLNDVTVNGGATVTSTGHLELENHSTIHGGVTVQPGGELDAGHVIFSRIATYSPSTIDGGIDYTNGLDLDLNGATVFGDVSINGSASFPTMCLTDFHGSVKVSNVTSGLMLIGDPGEPFQAGPHTDCPGNTIDGSLFVTNSRILEIEGNTVSGSVFIDTSTVEFAGNTIGGSAHCTGVTPFTDGDPSPNNCP